MSEREREREHGNLLQTLNVTAIECHVNTTCINVADFSGCKRLQDRLLRLPMLLLEWRRTTKASTRPPH